MSDAKKSSTQQLVAFTIDNEEYGVDIIQVQEVILKPPITHIPGMPDFIEGVINLRGKVIPIIDLRKRFLLKNMQDTEETRIVVANAADQTIGLIVDSVSEVIHLSDDLIDPIPPTISSIDAEYLSGVGKIEKRLIIIVNMDKLLNDIERVAVEQLSKKDRTSEKTEKATNKKGGDE